MIIDSYVSNLIEKKYTIIDFIGKGNMGAVLLVEDRNIGKKYALKYVCDNKELQNALKNECNVLRKISETYKNISIPYVVDFFEEYLKDNSITYFVMDYIPGTNFEDYIKNNHLGLDKAISYFKQMTSIVSKLHSLKPMLIFCDLKPSNFVIGEEDRLFLIDFGSVIENKENNNNVKIYGTIGYSAPELLDLENISSLSISSTIDTYSLGAIFYYMVTGVDPSKPPYLIKESYLSDIFYLPSSIKHILEYCLADNPDKRYENAIIIEDELKLLKLTNKINFNWISYDDAIYYCLLTAIVSYFLVNMQQFNLSGLLISLILAFLSLILGKSLEKNNKRKNFITKYLMNRMLREKQYITLYK